MIIIKSYRSQNKFMVALMYSQKKSAIRNEKKGTRSLHICVTLPQAAVLVTLLIFSRSKISIKQPSGSLINAIPFIIPSSGFFDKSHDIYHCESFADLFF